MNVVKEATRAELELRQQRAGAGGSMSRISTDRSPKSTEGTSNGLSSAISSQQDQVRPLLSLLEKEPPSRHYSGQLDVRHLAGMDRHESIMPLLHASNEKKTNGELDFLMAEFAGSPLFPSLRSSLCVHMHVLCSFCIVVSHGFKMRLICDEMAAPETFLSWVIWT